VAASSDVPGPAALGGESACFAHLLDDAGSADGRSSTLTLSPRRPFRLDLTARVLRRTVRNEVDRWDDGEQAYCRAVRTEAGVVEVRVTQTAPPTDPELEVRIEGPGATLLATRHHVATTLERSLGIGVDLDGFYELTAGDPFLGPLADRFRGVRPPRFHSWIEGLVAAVSCQQITLVAGVQLLNRLARLAGPIGPDRHPAFPSAEDLASVPPAQIRALGYSGRKAEVISSLSHGIACGDLDLDPLEHAADDEVRARLCELRGIGPWSAEYVMLRFLGRLHVFPGDDVGAQNKLQRLLGLDVRPDRRATLELLEQWAPYAGLIYFHLLLESWPETTPGR
jgi:DNA-3-methyladenine glycosylase II